MRWWHFFPGRCSAAAERPHPGSGATEKGNADNLGSLAGPAAPGCLNDAERANVAALLQKLLTEPWLAKQLTSTHVFISALPFSDLPFPLPLLLPFLLLLLPLPLCISSKVDWMAWAEQGQQHARKTLNVIPAWHHHTPGMVYDASDWSHGLNTGPLHRGTGWTFTCEHLNRVHLSAI